MDSVVKWLRESCRDQITSNDLYGFSAPVTFVDRRCECSYYELYPNLNGWFLGQKFFASCWFQYYESYYVFVGAKREEHQLTVLI